VAYGAADDLGTTATRQTLSALGQKRSFSAQQVRPPHLCATPRSAPRSSGVPWEYVLTCSTTVHALFARVWLEITANEPIFTESTTLPRLGLTVRSPKTQYA
jgi:hypothetical protein